MTPFYTTYLTCISFQSIWSASTNHLHAQDERYAIGCKLLIPTWGFAHIHAAQHYIEAVVRCLETCVSEGRSYDQYRRELEGKLQDLVLMTLNLWEAYRDYLAG